MAMTLARERRRVRPTDGQRTPHAGQRRRGRRLHGHPRHAGLRGRDAIVPPALNAAVVGRQDHFRQAAHLPSQQKRHRDPRGIPVMLVYGAEVFARQDFGHHPHGLDDPAPIVSFMEGAPRRQPARGICVARGKICYNKKAIVLGDACRPHGVCTFARLACNNAIQR